MRFIEKALILFQVVGRCHKVPRISTKNCLRLLVSSFQLGATPETSGRRWGSLELRLENFTLGRMSRKSFSRRNCFTKLCVLRWGGVSGTHVAEAFHKEFLTMKVSHLRSRSRITVCVETDCTWNLTLLPRGFPQCQVQSSRRLCSPAGQGPAKRFVTNRIKCWHAPTRN